jgi:hypothetical protein
MNMFAVLMPAWNNIVHRFAPFFLVEWRTTNQNHRQQRRRGNLLPRTPPNECRRIQQAHGDRAGEASLFESTREDS